MINFIKNIDKNCLKNYKYNIILHLLKSHDISLSILKKYLLLMYGTTDNCVIYNILLNKIGKKEKIEIKNEQYMKQILLSLFNNNFIDNHDYEKYEILKYLLSPVKIGDIDLYALYCLIHKRIDYKIYLYLLDIFKITLTNKQIKDTIYHFIEKFMNSKKCITETDLNYINNYFNTFIECNKLNIKEDEKNMFINEILKL